MLRKSLIISLIGIFALLFLQSIWLVKIINQEKSNYKVLFEKVVNEAIGAELNERLKKTNVKNKINVEYVSKKVPYNKPYSKKIVVDSKDVGDEQSFKITMEQIFQEMFRKEFPLNLANLSGLIDKELKLKNLETDFDLRYVDIDSTRKISINSYRTIKFFSSSFNIVCYLDVKKSIKLYFKVYFPIAVYKGQFLLIGLSSFLLLFLIVFALIVQTRMLSTQISMAQLKENLSNFFTHELRSPLQTALSGVEMIETAREKEDYSKIKKYSEITKEKLLYINSFIEKLLDINKLKRSKSKLNKEKFLLSDMIYKTLDNCIFDKNKDIKFELTDRCKIEVFGDKMHLSNAVCNMIENSVKYSGAVVGIKIDAKQEKKYTYIIIEDNGIGIPVSDQKKIFEQFYRVNEGTHLMKSKGFGLGLNYVKWVADAHSGKIEVDSIIGEGSKFTMSIKNK